MNDKRIAVNGVDASSGGYLGDGLTASKVAAAARGEMGVGGAGIGDREVLEQRHRRDREKTLGPMAGIRVNDLASAGWGVVFASNVDPAVVEALQPLLDLRARQAGGCFQRFAGHEGYRVGSEDESVRSFLKRRRVLPSMPADPQRRALLPDARGQPGRVPFRFQYGLRRRLCRGPALVREPRRHARPRRVRPLCADPWSRPSRSTLERAGHGGRCSSEWPTKATRRLRSALTTWCGRSARPSPRPTNSTRPAGAWRLSDRRRPASTTSPAFSTGPIPRPALHGEPRGGVPERAPAPVAAPGRLAVPGLARAARMARRHPCRPVPCGRRRFRNSPARGDGRVPLRLLRRGHSRTRRLRPSRPVRFSPGAGPAALRRPAAATAAPPGGAGGDRTRRARLELLVPRRRRCRPPAPDVPERRAGAGRGPPRG